jgi:lipoprotein-anchoring transpeptidase ErfK/SrfK
MISRTSCLISTVLIALSATASEVRAQYYYVHPSWRAYPPPYRPLPRAEADDDYAEPQPPYYQAPTRGRATDAEANAAPTGPQQVDARYAALPPEDQPETGPRKELPPQLRRALVDYVTNESAGTIVIDTPNTYLYFVLGNGKALRYGIGVGREGFTWAGTEKISRMAQWPDWNPPEQMIERQPYLPRFMAGGDGNPLGARALYLGDTLYRIHGTNQPSTIGSFVSSGCIRLTNEDVTDLYSRVKVGTRVVVLSGKERIGAAPIGLRRGATVGRGGTMTTPDVAAKKRRPPQEAVEETTTGTVRSDISAAHANAPRMDSTAKPARETVNAEHAPFEE